MPSWHLETLGTARLTHLDAPAAPVLAGQRKLLALIAWLVAQPRPVTRARLASLFWEDREGARARQSLRQALSTLRRMVGPALAEAGDTVGIVPDTLQTDVASLERYMAAGDYQAAVSLWGGEFLAGLDDAGGLDFQVWLDAERGRLARLYDRALEGLAAAAAERGDWSVAVGWAERRWSELPVTEARGLALIELLRQAGRHADARARLDALRTRLHAELGREPSQEVERIGSLLAREERPASHARPDGRPEVLSIPELAGRGPQFEVLMRVWRHVAGGDHGAAVIISGPEGSGRTRLCDEWLRSLIAADGGSGFTLLRARAYAAEQGAAWAALRDVLEKLHSAPGLGGAPDADLSVLSALAPALRERFRALPSPPPPVRPDVAAAMHRVLGDTAVEQPVIVLLDDFPEADDSTREVLLSLCRRPPSGVLLLLTVAPGDADVDVALDELRSAEGVTWLELAPLTRAEIARLVDSMIHMDPADSRRLAQRVAQDSDGTPFHAVALVAALVDAGHICGDPGGTWRLSSTFDEDPLPLPRDVSAAFAARLARLHPDSRSAAAAAAVAGGPVQSRVLQAMAGLPDERWAAALDDLFSRQILLEEQSEGGPCISFAHDLHRRAVAESLNPARREALHRAASAALGQPAPSDDRMLHAQDVVPVGSISLRRAKRLITMITAALLGGAAIVYFATDARRASSGSNDVVAVFPFVVHGAADADYLGEGMVDLLSLGLDGAGGLRAVDPHVVFAATRGMSRALDPQTARHVAARLGARRFVLGGVTRSGARLQLYARMYGADGTAGEVVESSSAADSLLLDAADELARGLIAGLFPQNAMTRTAALATRSSDALKAYLHGEAEYRAGRYDSAVDAFSRAVALDSAFALANFRLAVATEWGSQTSPDLLLGAIDRAARHAPRLPARQRHFLEGFTAYHRGAAAVAESRFRAVLAEWPDDVEAWMATGEVLFHVGVRTGRERAMEDAGAAFQRVLALAPEHEQALVHLARVHAATGNARALDSVMVALAPVMQSGNPAYTSVRAMHLAAREDSAGLGELVRRMRGEAPIFVYVSAVFIAVYAQDPAAAITMLSPLATEYRPLPVRGAAHAMLAQLEHARGNGAVARSHLTRAEDAHPLLGLQVRALTAVSPYAPAARPELDALLRRVEAARAAALLPPGEADMPYITYHPGIEVDILTYLAGLLRAHLGDDSGAEACARTLDASGHALARAHAIGIRATVAKLRGRSAQALGLLETLNFETWHQWSMGSPFVSLARERDMRADLLRAVGRQAESSRWRHAQTFSTPWDLPYVRAARLP